MLMSSNELQRCSGAFWANVSLPDKKNRDENNNQNCDNKTEVTDESIVISGCSDYETEIDFSGPYLLTINEKTMGAVSTFELFQPAFNSYMGVKASSASALRNDGWYNQASIWENLNGKWKWRVKATGEYKIVFEKLPLTTAPATAPVTYNSAGQTVLGPVHLNGSTTFSISCPDAKLAGFTAELFDAETGDEILEDYANILGVVNWENNQQINNYSKDVTVELPEKNYLIKVSSNFAANWTVSIN
ncbi:MAG: hypothetical protein HC906_04620 [Bacteroidales bacterium]|nr:hypothetical protein [Bacteroidales bacterium]